MFLYTDMLPRLASSSSSSFSSSSLLPWLYTTPTILFRSFSSSLRQRVDDDALSAEVSKIRKFDSKRTADPAARVRKYGEGGFRKMLGDGEGDEVAREVRVRRVSEEGYAGGRDGRGGVGYDPMGTGGRGRGMGRREDGEASRGERRPHRDGLRRGDGRMDHNRAEMGKEGGGLRTRDGRIEGSEEGGGLASLLSASQRDGDVERPPRREKRDSLRKPSFRTRDAEAAPRTGHHETWPAGRIGRERREKMGPVPGHGDTGAKSPFDKYHGSTMTAREKAIFEQLLEKGSETAGDDSAETRGRRKTKRPALDDILKGVVADVEAEEVEIPAASDEKPMRFRKVVMDAVSLHGAAKNAMDSFLDGLARAQTDVKLWAFLEHEVYKPLRALKLDDVLSAAEAAQPAPGADIKPQASTAESTADTKTESKPKSKSNPKTTPSTPLAASPPKSRTASQERTLAILTENLPRYLPEASFTLRRSFPTSPLPLSLLPTLRAIGPTALALGASPALFNQHMQLLYRRHADLDGVLAILEEMDRGVYVFDVHTLKVVQAIIRHAGRAGRGVHGEAERAVWGMERLRGAVEGIKGWGLVVGRRLEEEALREARERGENLRNQEKEEEAVG